MRSGGIVEDLVVDFENIFTNDSKLKGAVDAIKFSEFFGNKQIYKITRPLQRLSGRSFGNSPSTETVQ